MVQWHSTISQCALVFSYRVWITWMTDIRHLLRLWLHHTNYYSELPQILYQQLNKSPSIHIFYLSYLPVIVGYWEGSMHSHSYQITTSRWSYPVQSKKAFKLLSTIRTVIDNSLDVPVVVVWMVSDIKELLYFPNQLLLVSIYQTVFTCLLILPNKDTFTAKDIHVHSLMM